MQGVRGRESQLTRTCTVEVVCRGALPHAACPFFALTRVLLPHPHVGPRVAEVVPHGGAVVQAWPVALDAQKGQVTQLGMEGDAHLGSVVTGAAEPVPEVRWVHNGHVPDRLQRLERELKPL